MHQYWIEEGRFDIEEQHLTCQVRSKLKTEKLSEVEIETLRWKVTTRQESVEVLIENDPVEGSDVTSVIEIGVEQNHPASDGGWRLLMSYIKMMILREEEEEEEEEEDRKIAVILYLHYEVRCFES